MRQILPHAFDAVGDILERSRTSDLWQAKVTSAHRGASKDAAEERSRRYGSNGQHRHMSIRALGGVRIVRITLKIPSVYHDHSHRSVE